MNSDDVLVSAQLVLTLSNNESLLQTWQQLNEYAWQPIQGRNLQDLEQWREQGQTFVILDVALLKKPEWISQNWVQLFHGLQVLVLSAQMSDQEGQLVLGKGASGYHHTHASAHALARILDALADGAIWMGTSLLQKLLQDIDARLPPVVSTETPPWKLKLSAREIEVAQLAAIGQSNQDIADQLHITERTVRAHMSAIFEKLALNDRLKLALIVHGIRPVSD